MVIFIRKHKKAAECCLMIGLVCYGGGGLVLSRGYSLDADEFCWTAMRTKIVPVTKHKVYDYTGKRFRN